MDKEIIHKELDLVQAVISRMANNSFVVKGWTITLNTAIFLLLREDILTSRIYYVAIPMILGIILFWRVDSFFLYIEKCYRQLYKHKISKGRKYDDLYSLDYSPFKKSTTTISRTMVDGTIWPFYAIPIVLIVAVVIFESTL